jgi:hypothetical protein
MARDFLYPIAFGILLSYLLYPIVNFFEKKVFPGLNIADHHGIGFAWRFCSQKDQHVMDELPPEKMINQIELLQHSGMNSVFRRAI